MKVLPLTSAEIEPGCKYCQGSRNSNVTNVSDCGWSCMYGIWRHPYCFPWCLSLRSFVREGKNRQKQWCYEEWMLLIVSKYVLKTKHILRLKGAGYIAVLVPWAKSFAPAGPRWQPGECGTGTLGLCFNARSHTSASPLIMQKQICLRKLLEMVGKA